MKVVVHENSLMLPLETQLVGEDNHPKVECLCRVCGSLKEADVWGLKSGAIISCGCLRSLLPRKDITGTTTAQGIKVIGYVGSSLWRVEYVCGHVSDTKSSTIFKSSTGLCNSCSKTKTCKDRNTKHNMCDSGTYQSWVAMRRRCYDAKNNRYANYGGKGITVCERWLNSFENFLADMGECPDGYSIDRIDNLGNYEPSNCRWATDIEQANNKANNLLFTDGNNIWSLKRWCEILNKDYKHIWYKHKTCGIPIEVLFDGKLFSENSPK